MAVIGGRLRHRKPRQSQGVFVLGQLTGEERAAVRSHVDSCASCRAEVVALLGKVDAQQIDHGQCSRNHQIG